MEFLQLVFILLVFSFSNALFAQSYCTTPTQDPGECILITECSTLLSILQNRSRSKDQTQMLRDSQCGAPPKSRTDVTVCCPSISASRPTHLQERPTPPLAPVTNQNRIEPALNVDHLLPSPDSCGQVAGEDRILGGNATNIDTYPWMALVEYRNSRGSISLGCGATLISKRYVITAGRCVFGSILTQLGTPFSIRLGEYDKSTEIDCQQVPGGQDCADEPVTIGIEEIIPHPDYQPSRGTEMNDIAVIRLAHDAPDTYFIRPICLPKSDITTQSDVEATIAGWGTTETAKSSNVKLHMQIPLVSLAKCQVAYMNPKTPRLGAHLWDKQLCAGGQAGKDSCRGDSGGPLMVTDNTEPQWFLHGVVSFGPTPCTLPDMPGVYSKVFAYLDWIKAQIRE